MSNKLEVEEGTRYQSADEEKVYTITTTKLVSNPTSPTAVAFDLTTGETVTSTVFPTNSPSVSGDVITLSPLKSLSKGHTYRIEVLFTVGSSKHEGYIIVQCEI